MFAPIAIVGRACVLPGADSPAALWSLVRGGHDQITAAPQGRWRVDAASVLCPPQSPAPDRTWTDRGGYVRDFDAAFDASRFGIGADELAGLDPVFLWTLHTAAEALADASHPGARHDDRSRVGAVFGNLSFPAAGMSRFAEATWRGEPDVVDPRNRFCSGLPALLLERALGLGVGAFALDAACASSLYAIKTACDWLHDGRADLVLAGAVNCADDLFIHMGFCALQALSKSGRSRPFHAEADGLMPAEGAGFVALRRLDDAVRDGDTIHGVIRGVGLSNDGSGKGFLVPSAEGQLRALRAAYAQSGLAPSDISLLECHATGTQLGDATELSAAAEAFAGRSEALPIGSLKSNLGHLITAAGVAGLIKVCEAMRAGERPPTLHADVPTDAVSNGPFRLLNEAEPWVCEGPRRAGVSAFGFGGNNAHLIVEEYVPTTASPTAARRETQAEPEPDIAVVGLAVRAAGCADVGAFARILASGESQLVGGEGRMGPLELAPLALGIPPLDLPKVLPQQLAMLDVGLAAVAQVSDMPGPSTGVFVGMGADPEVARYGDRWRNGSRSVDALTSAGVIGTMPNIPANRLNRQLNFGGPSCTVSAEEHSGLRALELATRALRRGELDAAVVGAVDLSCEVVHVTATAAMHSGPAPVPGDAAVALVLKRADDAARDGDTVLALLPGAETGRGDIESAERSPTWGRSEQHDLETQLGHAHAASGLLHLAAACVALHHRTLPGGRPWLSAEPRHAFVRSEAMLGARPQRWCLREGDAATTAVAAEPARLSVYAGASTAALADAIRDDRCCTPEAAVASPLRAVIVAQGVEQHAQRRTRAVAHLERGAPAGLGVHVRAAVVRGETAFVFTSAGSSYAGMARPLLNAMPELGDRVAARFSSLHEALAWSLDGQTEPTPEQRLWAAAALCQLHARVSLDVLGLRPDAAIGYSSGESSSLFSLGAWRDPDAMRDEAAASAMFRRDLAGDFETVKAQWGAEADWQMWSVRAPLDEVREALEDESRVRLAIVHTDADVVVGGDAVACQRVVQRIGAHRCSPLAYNMCVHVPELEPCGEGWLALHRRETFAVPGVRFYSGGRPDAYVPEREACAQTIYGQARRCLDVPVMIERAWADGVRVFVEHGPAGVCSRWIRDILGPSRCEQAVIVALDHPDRGAEQLLEAAAALVAAGVTVDVDALVRRLGSGSSVAERGGHTLVLPSHPPLVASSVTAKTAPTAAPKAPVSASPLVPPTTSAAPAAASSMQLMKPAPALPSVLDQGHAPQVRAPAADAASPQPTSSPRTAGEAVSVAPAQPVSEPPSVVEPVTGAEHPLAALAKLHRGFLQQQAEVHQSFLESRSRMWNAVTAQSSVAPPQVRLPTPVSPVPTPSPVTPAAVAPRPAAAQAPARPEPPAPTLRPADPATPATKPASLPGLPQPSGPTFGRAQLEVNASGVISEIFGPLFAQQDGFERQVRMPEPPLLLADRVTGIDAEPGVMGVGTIWTETDVCTDSWYLHRGRMPGGIFIESGQADLMLISWMGADLLNRSERVYRLLGCTLTFGGDLPAPGDTLSYDIHVDGHAQHDDVRLFFFHYDCRIGDDVRLAVRNGQAGFFTDAELAASEGVLWDPQTAEAVAQPRLDAPDQLTTARSFTREQIEAFADGRPWDCFGEGFERAHTHTHTPCIQGGRMLFLDEVTAFEPGGGPWGRGYLRARTPVSPDDWYFDGHFKNDPCMPGTLMFEGCFQALSLYLSALGYTLGRDGWRFQPVPGEPIDMKCRGQVTPGSKETIYEVFVEEIIAGPTPTIYADLLCTVDGLKAFHAKRVGLQLVPDWPLQSWTHLLAEHTEPKPVASVALPDGGRFAFDYASLLACAWGRPSAAFGPMYAPFDSDRTAPRLPGPPYHFMSRITEVHGEIGVRKAGARIIAEYDVPPDAWYFDDNGARTMPFAVLLEAALQPCGWLASYIGSVVDAPNDLLFRNLDGTGVLLSEVLEDAGCIRTKVTLTSVSKASGMVITGFDVEMSQGGTKVYELKTVFGCFPLEAFENQAGLAIGAEDRALLEQPCAAHFDLDARPEALYRGGACLPGSKLDMLNEITGYWPQGGAAGLGAMRGQKTVRFTDWYFKAHFFQDPVQPGSLGIEAMIQLLQAYMLLEGLHEGIEAPRFEPLALGVEMTWKYRGQVVPTNDTVHCTLEITDRGRDEQGAYAVARASLWVDGLRIYSAEGLGMRIVAGGGPKRTRPPKSGVDETVTLDPARDTWLADHCPTWGQPALPMMSIVDLLARAVPGVVTAVRDVAVRGWIDVPQPRSFRTVATAEAAGHYRVRLLEGEGPDAPEVARARVEVGDYPDPPAPWCSVDGADIEDPYASGALFHGPAFQRMVRAKRDGGGASSWLDPAPGEVPVGALHPSLLDAALHAIPHDELWRWSPDISRDRVAYPARVEHLRFFGPTPTQGEVRCEVRFDGFVVAPDLPAFLVQWIVTDGDTDVVWAEGRLVEACFPKGPLGSAPADQRRAFLRDQRFVPGLRLSEVAGGETRLTQATVDASDWMPGTIEAVYGQRSAARIAVLEHIGAREGMHPGRLPDALPLNAPHVEVRYEADTVVVTDAPGAAPPLDPAPVRSFWAKQVGHDRPWVGQDLWEGLLRTFVRRVTICDPKDFAQVRGGAAIYVANHQVQIESLLITQLLGGLTGRPVTTMANAKHEQRWIGWILRLLFSYPGASDPGSIVYFDQSDPASMLTILDGLRPTLAAGEASFFLHPQGTRSRSCRERVETVSSTILDLAVAEGLPVVPVRLSGGLPVEPVSGGKLEFPWGYGGQDYAVGAAIPSAELAALPYAERSRRVRAAMAGMEPDAEHEQPHAPAPEFERRVSQWRARFGVGEVEAVFATVLAACPEPSDETSALLGHLESGTPLQPNPALAPAVATWLEALADRLGGRRATPKAG